MKSLLLIVASLCLLGLSSCSHSKQDYTFVVCGDNRVAPEDTANDPSTTNTYQLNRMFDEISKLNPEPKFLIFNGDLVMGYCDGDTTRFEHELKEWVKLYKASSLSKTKIQLVALPGNHETCEKIGSGKIAVEANEKIFVRVMKDYIMNNNGPHATGLIPGTDSLMTDQSRLSYSFDFGGDHFVILDSDPVARESRVPNHWLNKDLASARKDGARHIFAFVHKPAFESHFPSETAMEEFKSNRDSLWACMEKYNSDVLFCSHFHVWDTLQPHKGKTWQIVVGNAGAPMVKDWLPYYYGFTIVKVSDKVDITSMGRDCDKDHYTAPSPDKLTMIRAHLIID